MLYADEIKKVVSRNLSSRYTQAIQKITDQVADLVIPWINAERDKVINLREKVFFTVFPKAIISDGVGDADLRQAFDEIQRMVKEQSIQEEPVNQVAFSPSDVVQEIERMVSTISVENQISIFDHFRVMIQDKIKQKIEETERQVGYNKELAQRFEAVKSGH